MLTVEVYRGRQGLEALSPDWQCLLEQLGHKRFFHFHGWWKSYLGALDGDPESVAFYLVRRDGRPVAIIPLKRSGSRFLWLGTYRRSLPQHPHLPLNDILCARDVSVSDVLDALRGTLREREKNAWDVLLFSAVLEESPLSQYATRARGRIHASVLQTCDDLMCCGPYEDITAKFKHSFRSNLNKSRKKLAQETDVRFVFVTEQPDLTRCFLDFLDLEASGWKGSEGTSTAIKLHPDLTGFYEALIADLSPSRAVIINGLVVDGKMIAGQFCVSDDDSLYVLKVAYDEAWSRVDPGHLLLERVIRHGIEGQTFTHVNMVGNPPWFKAWRPDTQNVYNISIYNSTLAGWLQWYLMKAKNWLRPFGHKYGSKIRSIASLSGMRRRQA